MLFSSSMLLLLLRLTVKAMWRRGSSMLDLP
jgi:hypothetical protein